MMSQKHSKFDKLDPVTRAFAETHPETCAAVTTTWQQKLYYSLLVLFLLFLLKYRWDLFVFLVCGVLMLLYAGAVLMRLIAGVYTVFGYGEERVSSGELAALSDKELPVYTILIPLYKEPEVAQKILKRIAAFIHRTSWT